jgi:hypothetical protein
MRQGPPTAKVGLEEDRSMEVPMAYWLFSMT